MSNNNEFTDRHTGSGNLEIKQMLHKISARSIDQLIEETIPKEIQLTTPLHISSGLTEYQYLKSLRSIAAKNQSFRSYIGMGYYNTILPAVIQRNILENPGWYTAYTPYQAEISQGRLEALLNFQTMIADLTGLPVANASLLDEGTAAAEAMIMFYNFSNKSGANQKVNKFFVSQNCFPQTIDVIITRAKPLEIDLIVGDINNFQFDETFFGVLLQYPDVNGEINDHKKLVADLSAMNIKVCVATDLMALAIITAPGEWGADCVVGNSQRFGMPLGYGGPHAAFFSCKDAFKRFAPGRIIGISKDNEGKIAYRMALQTREQHIKREKATSNICTAQALPAIIASMYAVYHGPKGIKSIANKIHFKTSLLASEIDKLGYPRQTKIFFDTLVYSGDTLIIKPKAEEKKINFRYISKDLFSISLDETTGYDDLLDILKILAAVKGLSVEVLSSPETPVSIISEFKRSSEFLQYSVFKSYHSETEMMRYIKLLERKDLSLVHSMISLGSCTMKLNAAAELLPITWPEFADIHPFVPLNQVSGYLEIIDRLSHDLCEITGLEAISFQPNSGAQGEYAGLLVIMAYHKHNNNSHRNIALIPASAHGTNPASASMAGMQIVVIRCDEQGNIDLNDLKEKAEQHRKNLGCLMVTYPSTHGVFEESIKEIIAQIHDYGGMVYMDGANMNAQVGLTSPGFIGADVCHLNLHKTFAIPHGGGGPGMGPIAVAKHLVPFLPGHTFITDKLQNDSVHAVSSAPFGSALILLISYGYIKMLGSKGLAQSTKMAILNANYLKDCLKPHFKILFSGKHGRCAHEFIIDCSAFKAMANIEAGDIARRLMDYGYHAPTVSFPVHDTLMIEPTESESKAELDRFCEAMISIRIEIEEISLSQYDITNNVLKNAPHTMSVALADNWDKPYSRQKAVFPCEWVKENKFWPSVGKIDNAFGDRNLICTCTPAEEYSDNIF
jgi:glycine dehydrogenase